MTTFAQTTPDQCEALTHSGSCLCGGVRYAVSGPLPPIQVCHCGQCRKAQGTPFATNIPVSAQAFTLLAGADLLSQYESTPGKLRVFCRRCGSPIYSQRTATPEVLRIRAGTFDSALPVVPDAHAFVGSKANWWSIADDLPQYKGERPAGLGLPTAMPLIKGMDHVYITVSNMAASEDFYDRVFLALGFRKNRFELNGESHAQYFGQHFGYVIRPARNAIKHDPYAPGLHHFCLRVDSVDDVQRAYKSLSDSGISASEPARFEEYAEDYFSVYFSDPDGVRLEITNYRDERRQRHDHWCESGA